MQEIVRWSLIILAIVIIVWLVGRTIRRARALSERIEEYHKEQEENPMDPYAALAELLEEQRRDREKRE